MLEGHVENKTTQGPKRKDWDMQTEGGEVEKYLKEADVPLVGYFANDTENRFTAGIDNNSEEIKQKSLVLLWATETVGHVWSFPCSV